VNDIKSALRLTAELEEALQSRFDDAMRDGVRPTRSVYGRITNLPEGDAAFAAQFKQTLSERNRHIRDHFTWKDEEQKLKLFPLLQIESSSTGDYDTTVAEFLQCFARERTLLERDFNTDATKLGKELRQARKRKNETEQEVADFFGCDTSTISRIESGRQIPDLYAEAIKAYIERQEKLHPTERYSRA